jgi:hypothetical protein
MNKDNLITTSYIDTLIKKIESGEKVKRSESIFYQSNIGLLNSKYTFSYTKDEMIEWVRCYDDPIYFIEKYCKIITHSGLSNIKLRNYQLDWIKSYLKNRFNIFLNSRQIGFSIIKSLINLWEIVFHNKQILIISNKTNLRNIEIIKESFLNLPYFLKSSVRVWNKKNIYLSNNGSIKLGTINNLLSRNFDIIDINEAFYMTRKKQEKILKTLIPISFALKNSRLNISGCVNGSTPLYNLVNSSSFNVIRTYWWQVEGRDENWKNEMIKDIGSEELFNIEFNLMFTVKK